MLLLLSLRSALFTAYLYFTKIESAGGERQTAGRVRWGFIADTVALDLSA